MPCIFLSFSGYNLSSIGQKMHNLSLEEKKITVLDSLLLDAEATDVTVIKLKFIISRMVCFDPLSRMNAVDVQTYLNKLKLGKTKSTFSLH